MNIGNIVLIIRKVILNVQVKLTQAGQFIFLIWPNFVCFINFGIFVDKYTSFNVELL